MFHSEKTKQKMSETRKRMGIKPPSALGRIWSLESRKKLSNSRKGIKLTDAHIEKLKISHTGIKQSFSTVQKRISKTIGLKRTKDTKIKISNSHKGNKCYRWNSDRDFVFKNVKDRMTTEYREWRLEVYKRDNYKCRINNIDCLGKVVAHHILNWIDYPELRYIINNGITLCQFHHPRKRKDEEKLSPYFQELVIKMK